MPPKPKFTREEIIEAAVGIVSEKGMEGLTARELGNVLGSSARPIFTVFRNMEELLEEVREGAMKRFNTYAQDMIPDMPLFKQIGMKMVLFGMNESKLYQFLFMRDEGKQITIDDMFERLGSDVQLCIRAIQDDYGLDKGDARTLFENIWIYTFGIGALCATGMCSFSEERVGQMLSTEFQAMMQLLKADN